MRAKIFDMSSVQIQRQAYFPIQSNAFKIRDESRQWRLKEHILFSNNCLWDRDNSCQWKGERSPRPGEVSEEISFMGCEFTI
jgi:hypothetical protein